MKGASFKDVVIRGRELTGALITALINVYIKDSASVDAISNHLRDICPLLYSSDDSVCSKVVYKHALCYCLYDREDAHPILTTRLIPICSPWAKFDSIHCCLLGPLFPFTNVSQNYISPSLCPSQANELLQGSRQIQTKIDKERTLRESLQLYQLISQHTDLPLVCSQYRQGKAPHTPWPSH